MSVLYFKKVTLWLHRGLVDYISKRKTNREAVTEFQTRDDLGLSEW